MVVLPRAVPPPLMPSGHQWASTASGPCPLKYHGGISAGRADQATVPVGRPEIENLGGAEAFAKPRSARRPVAKEVVTRIRAAFFT